MKTTFLDDSQKPVVTYLTLSALKKELKTFDAEVSRKHEKLAQYRFGTIGRGDSGKPQFVSVSRELTPILISFRMVSKKEYYHAKEQERLDNLAAWEAYGERKLGC
ncbi:MAG: hypothetical protein IPK80_02170 [Nannocystis sp.]|nr:hypothetical protein [Nannocystis sp.]